MMLDTNGQVLEGIFAVEKPSSVSSADVLLKLQATFATSEIFAPLRNSQPKRPSKSDEQVFKLGHGGTLDPLAAGVLVVGIGRGTKHLQQFLACNKTYETVVLFGQSTDSYDCTGVITDQADFGHVNKELVEQQLETFRGIIKQAPPVFSALKINGVKACAYARKGEELPRPLESREVHVDECTLLDWIPTDMGAPAVRIRLVVSSGFYVRSFAHDLGLACRSRAHMVSLVRTRQASFSVVDYVDDLELVTAITYADLDKGEQCWASKLRPQLESWVGMNPAPSGHIDGRDAEYKRKATERKANRPSQRFRGEWLADSKSGRIKQQSKR